MRVEQIGDATLYRGDCLEILPTLSGVDAVVTDPPYGVRRDDWDSMTDLEFAAFSMQWLSVAKAKAAELIAFGTCGGAVEVLMRMLFPMVRQMIWHKPLGSQYNGAQIARRFYAFEPIFHGLTLEKWEVVTGKTGKVGEQIKTAREAIGLSRSGVDIRIRGKKTGLCYRWEEGACLPTPDQIRVLKSFLPLNEDFDLILEAACNQRDETLKKVAEKAAEKAAEKIDVLSYRTVTKGDHPTQKPVALMQDLISVIDCQTVLDPFMGSGTTGVSCANLGRKFIGVERKPEYFDIACERIERAYQQPRLFEDKELEPVQLDLEAED